MKKSRVMLGGNKVFEEVEIQPNLVVVVKRCHFVVIWFIIVR